MRDGVADSSCGEYWLSSSAESGCVRIGHDNPRFALLLVVGPCTLISKDANQWDGGGSRSHSQKSGEQCCGKCQGESHSGKARPVLVRQFNYMGGG